MGLCATKPEQSWAMKSDLWMQCWDWKSVCVWLNRTELDCEVRLMNAVLGLKEFVCDLTEQSWTVKSDLRMQCCAKHHLGVNRRKHKTLKHVSILTMQTHKLHVDCDPFIIWCVSTYPRLTPFSALWMSLAIVWRHVWPFCLNPVCSCILIWNKVEKTTEVRDERFVLWTRQKERANCR